MLWIFRVYKRVSNSHKSSRLCFVLCKNSCVLDRICCLFLSRVVKKGRKFRTVFSVSFAPMALDKDADRVWILNTTWLCICQFQKVHAEIIKLCCKKVFKNTVQSDVIFKNEKNTSNYDKTREILGNSEEFPKRMKSVLGTNKLHWIVASLMFKVFKV